MSYSIYTTDGIVLKRTPFGEQNVLISVLTKDLGMINASAQAARSPKSKLNSALQEYSLVSLSCVKGKNIWKITNAEESTNFFFDGNREKRQILARLRLVLLQTIAGEFPQPEIFETVFSGFEFLKSMSTKDISNFEILTVLRILHALGYVVLDSETKAFLESKELSENILEKVSPKKSILISVINKALKESQLT